MCRKLKIMKIGFFLHFIRLFSLQSFCLNKQKWNLSFKCKQSDWHKKIVFVFGSESKRHIYWLAIVDYLYIYFHRFSFECHFKWIYFSRPSHFSSSSLFETTQTLFWAVFGLVDLDSFELEGIKIFTRFWGMLMFGTYSVINIVVLLNLLIAMMNHSYQLISVSLELKRRTYTSIVVNQW